MAKDTYKRISEIVPLESVRPAYTKPDEIIGHDLIIMGYEMVSGQLGEYAVITAQSVATGEEITVSTGGAIVLAMLHRAEELGEIPFIARFEKSGRQYIMI